MRISCLHTADSNVAVFDAAAQALGLTHLQLHHVVREDLLLAAEESGGLTPDIADRTKAALLSLLNEADGVILTCSTLGPATEGISMITSVPLIRVDGALAHEAVKTGRKVIALCAVETTIASTTRVFLEAARETNALIEIRLVPGAWKMFKAGDTGGYLTAIADAADKAYEDGASVVALAQASMSQAASLVTKGPPPLSSPTAGLIAVINASSKHL